MQACHSSAQQVEAENHMFKASLIYTRPFLKGERREKKKGGKGRKKEGRKAGRP